MKRLICFALILILTLTALCAVGVAEKRTSVSVVGDVYQKGGFTSYSRVRSKAVYDTEGFEREIFAAWDSLTIDVDIKRFKISVDDIKNLYFNLVNMHPMYFYIGNTLGLSSDTSGYVTDIKIKYDDITLDGIASAHRAIEAETRNILSHIKPGMTDIEKIVTVNDYFCRNYEYDYGYDIYDIYNLFTKKKGVCQAYALGFLHVMNRLGIQCDYATSEKMKHIWNLVNVDGNWYHTDVTWNDGGIKGYAGHFHLLKSDSGITKSAVGEKDYHRDWVSERTANDDRFDGYLWSELCSSFVYLNGEMYYVKNWDGGSPAQMGICRVDLDKGKSYMKYPTDYAGYYGFGRLGKYLVFNYYDEILVYNPADDRVAIIKDESEPPSFEGGIMGFVNDGKSFTVAYDYVYNEATNTATYETAKLTLSPPTGEPAVTGISMLETAIEIDIGYNYALTAIISPDTAEVKDIEWQSDDLDVATVSDGGVVTGVGQGKAIITAKSVDGGFTATCEATVTSEIAVKSVVIGKDTVIPQSIAFIPVKVLNASGASRATFDITFNGDMFEYVGFTKGDMALDECAVDKNGTGEVSVSLARQKGVYGDGTLFTVKLKAAKPAIDQTVAISIEDLDVENLFGGQESFTHAPGEAVIKTGGAVPHLGDADKNGVLDSKDALAALGHTAFGDLDADGVSAADMNKNGAADVKDVVMMLRRLTD